MELSSIIQEGIAKRRANYAIAPEILGRWSPRAMSAEALTDEKLMSLFEAARWSPSSYNGQLWRFIYAKRDTPSWPAFFALLSEWNQSWAKNAAVLVVVIARKNFEYNEKFSPTHAFDAGAAWENLALEGVRRDLVVHGMEGFDYQKARSVLKVPAVFEILAMIAIGKRGLKADLPPKIQEVEFPNGRRPLSEIVMEGEFLE